MREGLFPGPGRPTPEGDVRSLQHVDEAIEPLERAPDALCIRIEILDGRARRGFIDFTLFTARTFMGTAQPSRA